MEIVEAEFSESQELAVSESTDSSVALFGTNDPIEILAQASRIASALVNVLRDKNLIVRIKDKDYPVVGAWQTLAAMLSITSFCEWSRPIEGGWESRVVIYNRKRDLIGSAEASCLKSECGKRSWEDYAIRSMSQTRATAKAYRANLGFIMVLAGYQATPAEEMPGNDEPPKNRVAPPKLEHLCKAARDCGLCLDADSFREWIVANVPECSSVVKGVKPTERMLFAIERCIGESK